MKLLDATVRLALKSLLFATDFSPASQAALPYAAAIARRYGSRLLLAHVLRPQVWAPAPPEWVPMESDLPRQAAMAEMAKLEQSPLLAGLPHEACVEEGAVWDRLALLMKRQETDLLIMGTHGRRGLQKLLMGSVAEELFRLAACPVLTVGPGVAPKAEEVAEFHRILYATDFSAESQAALPYAVSLAQENQARLTVLHVVEIAAPAYLADPQHALDSLKQRLQELLPREAALWCEPEFVLESGSPGEGILKVAKEQHADLIVLGVRPIRRLATHLPIATAHEVVCHAPCPVLTVRG
jgi:nucleotide-binding universal stress UspA family protein